ncbi:hypothetical protein [Streptomyces sp. TLI_55]|uniref:hypothetical protein n=1 Tax=Streptomyces sp. TLI_55 TaxID=1938861 RepID=UPI0015CF178B|nr:hypothetical protein [Streptomyces sp. TLI_55]
MSKQAIARPAAASAVPAVARPVPVAVRTAASAPPATKKSTVMCGFSSFTRSWSVETKA